MVEIISPTYAGRNRCIRVDQVVPRLLADAWTETISNLKRGVLESYRAATEFRPCSNTSALSI